MTGALSRLLQRITFRSITVSVLALTSALVVAAGNVSYTGSDPRGALLTAQAILEHGTLALNAYPDVPSDYKVVARSGHRFYSYPPGTPLAVLPAVAVARLLGFDMARTEDDDAVQRALAALSVGLTVMLASSLALRWLPWPLATTLAAILVLATPLISTMGTALWSTNLTVVVSLYALLLMSRYEAAGGTPLQVAAIGALLGFGFWCRPPAILLAGLTTLWMCGRAATRESRARQPAIVAALALGAGVLGALALLVILSRVTYGTWLPDYYIGARLAASERFGTALMAHLVSPSRGLLIFAPPATLALVAGLASPRRVLQAPLAALGLAWLCLHLLLVSRFPYWWGGYGYGSRLLVDALPGLFVFSCVAAAAVLGSARRWQVLTLLVLIPAAAAGLWINSVQGMFNTATAAWNVSPNIDRFPGYALDWRLPQFLATPARLTERNRRHERWLRTPLQPHVDYTAQSTRLELANWSLVERGAASVLQASTVGSSSIRFLVADETLRGGERMMLTLRVGAERPLAGELWFNGQRLAGLTIHGQEPASHVIGIPRALVRTMEYDVLQSNVLEWRVTPQGNETSLLLWALRIDAGRRRAS